MFDHLRQQSARDATAEEEEDRGPILQQTEAPARSAAGPRRGSNFLGLTPMQRFVLALMLFLNVSVLGFAALIVFERIVF